MRLLAFLILLAFSPQPIDQQDDAAVQKKLSNEGVVGHVHGTMVDEGMVVFTVRDEDDFSNFQIFTLIFPQVDDMVKGLKRHDKLRIYGMLLKNPSQQRHIMVSRFEILQRAPIVYNYRHQTALPDDLVGKEQIVALVHAIDSDKRILVIDYRDVIIPVFVTEVSTMPEVFEKLHRNDIIELPFVIRKHPRRPPHLELNGAIKVIDAIVDRHGKTVTYEGYLTMFPDHTQTKLNVFSLARDEGIEGIERLYTVTNFRDPGKFFRITNLLQKIWDEGIATVSIARNRYSNRKIRLRITGKIAVARKNQVNPMLLLKSRQAIEVL